MSESVQAAVTDTVDGVAYETTPVYISVLEAERFGWQISCLILVHR